MNWSPCRVFWSCRSCGVLDPGLEAGQAVAREDDLDAVGMSPRRAAVRIADREIGAGGELLAADLRLAVAREVEPLGEQEGVGPVARLLDRDRLARRPGDRGGSASEETSPERETRAW